ncbi:MAG: hypothetical protein HQL50_08260 [Magnetococcales bacterium]|nr:hypothetical protein [Magnetococcales bacterium]
MKRILEAGDLLAKQLELILTGRETEHTVIDDGDSTRSVRDALTNWRLAVQDEKEHQDTFSDAAETVWNHLRDAQAVLRTLNFSFEQELITQVTTEDAFRLTTMVLDHLDQAQEWHDHMDTTHSALREQMKAQSTRIEQLLYVRNRMPSKEDLAALFKCALERHRDHAWKVRVADLGNRLTPQTHAVPELLPLICMLGEAYDNAGGKIDVSQPDGVHFEPPGMDMAPAGIHLNPSNDTGGERDESISTAVHQR